MDDGSKPPLLWVIFLLLGAAYCAITETALSSASRNKIKVASDHGNPRAKTVLSIMDNFDKAITTLLICTNIFHIANASIVTVYVTRRWGLSAVTISTIITTIAVFFAGEMLPKSIAKKLPEKLILACAPLLSVLMKVLSPLSRLLTWIGQAATRRSKAEAHVSVTEDELHDIIDEMAEEGALDEKQSELISSALEFGDVTAEGILTPRVDIDAIDIDDEPDKILSFIKNQTHSRIPVYEGSIDNIIGVLQIRKFLKGYLQTGKMPSVRETMDEVYYAHQSTEIHELLPEMSKHKLSMAVITDSYGGTVGIVTVEDILEELVGEIWDESDVVQEPIERVGEDEYLADATQTLSAVFDFIDFDDPQPDDKDEANLQLGEWVYEQFSSIPKKDDSFTYYNLVVSVDSIEHNRILKVRIKVQKNEEPEKNEEAEK
ncbi:MAG: HlyC/CorC family transporter [Spirochaetales bacterium]|nr:HlyC/CorC family transporter [Spirochaetales bacterium]MBO7348721.1 HlyC/CorC family transporter [Spirochaetales bacterium]